jgi:NADPH-dependent glutamate synthase beta subunit-like oxidoreductase
MPNRFGLLFITIVIFEETDRLVIADADANLALFTILAFRHVWAKDVNIILWIWLAHASWLWLDPREGTSSHEEGCTRRWNINSLEFLGKNGKLTGVKVQPIDWKPNPEGGRPLMVEAGEPEIIKAEAVFLAMGFLKPQQPEFAENVFVAGDAASGASLVVRAMASGRKIAAQVDKFLNK